MRGPSDYRKFFQLGLGRRGVERAVDEELRFHLEMRAEDLMRAGISPEAAIAQARREFGDVGEARRELTTIGRRSEGRIARAEWWHGVLQDARVAVRAYVRQPGFTIAVLLTLAIGIGANTAVFSIVNAVLLRPLPYAQPERLVQIFETKHGDVSSRTEASYPDFIDWRGESTAFESLEGYDETNVTVSDANGAERVSGARITSGFFRMLGARLQRGRAFTSDDDAPGGATGYAVQSGTRAVILSHTYWVRRFGADQDVVGRPIIVDGVPYEIRGVLPPSFTFAPAGDAELWLPLGRSAEVRAQRVNHWVRVVGRLREGVTVGAARRRMNDVMGLLAARYPETNSGRGAEVIPLREVITAGVERPLLVLFGAVGLVLLIACANVAGLVLGRSIERETDIAVRSAIGASRARIVRQLVTEHFVLALAGAALGAWMAREGVRLLLVAMPSGLFEQMPRLRGASVDVAALGFATILALGTGVISGLAPALLASRRSAAELLRSDSRVGGGRMRHRLRDALVAAEIALTLVLLVGATLMGKSLLALLRVNPGFTADRVATVRVALAGPSYGEGAKQQHFFEELLARIRTVPGVEEAGAISSPPLQGGGTNTFHVDGAPEPPRSARPEATTRAVAGEYFRTLHIPLIEGRVLEARDGLTAPYAVVINASLARRLFGSHSAVGERLRFYAWEDSAWTIVGVVGDVKTDALDTPASPTIYYSHLQGPANRMSIVARSVVDPTTLISAMRREVHALDPAIAVYSAGTMFQYISRSTAVSSRRYLLVLLGAFAIVALLLAVIGVYGVIAFAVAQRTREIAIRIALGARQSAVHALVLRRGLRLVGVGLAIGAIAALALTRLLSTLLFGVRSADPWTYGLVSLLLVLVAVVASAVPAWRAARFDPAIALRSE